MKIRVILLMVYIFPLTGGRNVQPGIRNIEGGSPHRGGGGGPFVPQRAQRPRRMRRPNGPQFGNSRY